MLLTSFMEVVVPQRVSLIPKGPGKSRALVLVSLLISQMCFSSD